MIRRKPSYFDRFRCIAGACPDSCCQEWEVQVDERSAQRYLALPGPLGDRLREKLERCDDGYQLRITDRRCPMWRDDGLCQIQCELGEEGLCQVCREFPRTRFDYGRSVELGLELSCPEAARLILNAPSHEMVSEQVPGGEEPDRDPETMEILLRTREEALRILGAYPMPQALARVLRYAHRAQEELDGGGPVSFPPETELDLARQIASPGPGMVPLYSRMEILTPRWRTLLDDPGPRSDWTEQHRAFVRYGIQRYWLQAVSDWDLIGRVKLILSGCILIRSLGQDTVSLAQLWSKETENCPENMDALLDAAYTDPSLTDSSLFWELL